MLQKHLLLPKIIYMDIIESLEWRYATKKFNPEYNVSDKDLLTIKEAFNLTATSFGLQPIKMLVLKNKETREKLVPHAFGQKQVVDASHLLVICIQKDYTTKDIEKYFSLVKSIRDTPDAILDPFKNDLIGIFEKKSIEEIQKASKSQAYIALGNLLTVCATLKIDSCPMEGFLPEKLDKELDLASLNLKSVLLLPIGKRADDDYMSELKKVRRPLSESVLEIE